MRRARWLKSNKATQLPHNVIWVDTETREKRVSKQVVSHHLWFGYACHQRTYGKGSWTKPLWCRFTSQKRFWSFVERHTRGHCRLFLFAHNWAFDAPVLDMFSELPRRGWELRRAVVECPPVILKWVRDRATIEVVDTLNWWRMPLAVVGESIGMPKLPFPSKGASRKEWDTYGRNDVEIIRRVSHSWWDFIRTYDLGGFAPTLAGQSMRAFRHRFMDYPILIDDNSGALRIARASYHGGRTEAFRLGRIEGPIYCLDINSMYPFVMAEKSFPTVLKLFSKRVSKEDLIEWVKKYAVVATVKLQTARNDYAHPYKDKLVFPIGRFVACLTTPDLVAALQAGEVKGVIEAAVYDRKPIFRSFVETLYALRLRAAEGGNNVDKWLLKILMNSLYGKFAQKGIVWEDRGPADSIAPRSWVEIDAATGRVFRYRQFGGLLQQLSQETEGPASHPAIASHVTSYARRLLTELIECAGKSNVFYCDTDSIYTNSTGRKLLDKYIDPTRLGALKEEAVYPWIHIHGPKDYQTPGARVCKGVKAKAVWLADDRIEQSQWSRIGGLLADSQLSAPTTRTQVKVLKRVYGKGTVDRQGFVSPFHLREW